MEQSRAHPTDHLGVVTAVNGSTATVRFQRSKSCARCGACLALGESEMEAHVPNTLNARAGDTVAVSLAPSKLVGASLLAYCIPLAALLCGVLIGSIISDLWAALAGLGTCAAAFVLLRYLEPRWKRRKTFEPRMTAILNDSDEQNNGA